MGKGGGNVYIKGVTVRFGFDAIRISQVQMSVKNKATGTPYGGVSYIVLFGFCRYSADVREDELYTYIGVGLSALLVSTDRAMREPL